MAPRIKTMKKKLRRTLEKVLCTGKSGKGGSTGGSTSNIVGKTSSTKITKEKCDALLKKRQGKSGKSDGPCRKGPSKPRKLGKCDKPDKYDAPGRSVKFGRAGKVKKCGPKGKPKRQAANLKGWLKTPQDWARFNSWASVNARPRVVKEPPPICRESRSLLKLQKSIDRLSRPKRNFCQALVCRVPQISKHALKAKASTRILCLSLPNVRLTDEGRSPQWKVSRAAMSYCPSDRITELSQPKLRLEYAEPCIQWRKLSRRALLRYSASARERQLARAKNFADSPGVLSQQERRALYTPYGTKKSALCYEITPWMSLLALPKYSALKDKRSETAMKWKKQIVEESPIRSKQAFREYKMRYCLSSLGTGASGDASESRKKRQNAWRYAPPVCHPLSNVIKRSVLNYKASERTICLAMPKERKDIGCRKNPFSVRKGALNVTSTTRVNQLATAPPRKCRPSVPKKPPLKKDKYGRVLYQKAPFGKKLPKVPRYKERECTPKELEEMKKKREMLRRSACRSMKESTVDPLFDLSRAEKQKKERDRCKRILAARREKKLKGKKETREAEVDE